MKWQPIETAPKDGTKVDLWAQLVPLGAQASNEMRFPNCRWDEHYGAHHPDVEFAHKWSGCPSSYVPTHWMPLPEPPHPTPGVSE